jgi:PAS domain S-box-containing protein
MLIASSSSTPTVVKTEDETWQRLYAFDSENPTIAASSEYIIKELGDLEDFQTTLHLSIQLNGKDYYLRLSPFQNIEGLDWLIVTIIPKTDFLGAIEAHNRVTFLLTIIAITIAFSIGILTAIYITKPITQLSAAATKLAHGDWSQTVPIEGVQEVRVLGQSFNLMSEQLYELFTKLEDRVQRRTQALAISEARYRGIVEDQTELICRFTSDYRLTFVNDAYCRYFDKSPEQLLGKSFMPHLPQDDQAYLEQELASLNATQRIIKLEHRVITPHHDSLAWTQWTNRALYDETGQFTEFQAVGRDISESKQHQEALQKALEREMELNQLKSHFISTVSHEFRTPLTVILNSSEIIERYGERLSEEKKQTHFNRIQVQIQRMTDLLEDVLTIHEAETGKLELKLEHLDLVVLGQTVINELQTTAEDISFDFSYTETCKEVWGDEKLLRLILSNLISNAAKYSSSGSRIEVKLNCTPEKIQLSVKDEGIGIPQDVQPHIFVPFFRATNVETIMGTGLGLAIVKQSVERHYGEISFESEVDKGSCFTVILPNLVFKE